MGPVRILPPLLVVALAVVIGCCAEAAPIMDGSHVSEMTLDNGLRVIVKHEPYWGLVTFGFCVKASPLYESDSQRGLSDLVRYMMFDVAPAGSERFEDYVEDLGGSFDSYTSPDATQIRCTTSAFSFPEVLPRLVKATLEPRFDEGLWAQKLQELRRRLLDAQTQPMTRMYSLLWETAFRQHPYGRPIAGTADGIAAYTSQSLADFHKALYVPNNMSLIVVGDVTPQAVFDLAKANLTSYPSRSLKLPVVVPEPTQTEPRTRLEKAPVRGTLVTYAWRAVDVRNKRDVCTLDVLYTLLGEGENSRLTKALLEREQVSAVPEVEFITKRDQGLFVVTCISKTEAEFETRETVLSEVAKLRDTPVSAEELAKAKAVLKAGYAFDSQSYSSQFGSMAFYEAIDSYRFAMDYAAEVDRVTVEDVQRVAKTCLDPEKYNLVIIRPRSGGETSKEARLIP